MVHKLHDFKYILYTIKYFAPFLYKYHCISNYIGQSCDILYSILLLVQSFLCKDCLYFYANRFTQEQPVYIRYHCSYCSCQIDNIFLLFYGSVQPTVCIVFHPPELLQLIPPILDFSRQSSVHKIFTFMKYNESSTYSLFSTNIKFICNSC